MEVKKNGFSLKNHGNCLPECFQVARMRMGVQDSYMLLAKNWVPSAFFGLT